MDSDHRRSALIPVILMTVVPDEPAEGEAQRERWAQLLSDLHGSCLRLPADLALGDQLAVDRLASTPVRMWQRGLWPLHVRRAG